VATARNLPGSALNKHGENATDQDWNDIGGDIGILLELLSVQKPSRTKAGVAGYSSELEFMTFLDLSLPSELIAALSKQQISDPSPIQIAAIPPLIAGKDAYLRAETGTGKTLAYLLPLFIRIDPAQAATQVVIVAPTHELAIQIHRQSCELALNAARAIRSVLLIGGTSTDRQIDKLKVKPHLVVGSPGRIVELIERRKLKMAHIRAIVIDEADRLLNDESLNWIQTIVGAAPAGRQLIFASATIEQQTRRVLETLAPDVLMLRGGTAAVNERIEHFYLICEDRDKPDVLRKLLRAFDVPRSIVFVRGRVSPFSPTCICPSSARRPATSPMSSKFPPFSAGRRIC